MLDTPVLFIVFNRPETTEVVFGKIRQAAPRRLYIAADGPRQQVQSDLENCRKVRDLVSNIDWECEVKTLFQNSNLGCRSAVINALEWFYKEEAEGIVLEDDCEPDVSFFRYCDTLLDKFRNNEEISIITGTNYSVEPLSDKYDYYIGDFTFIWGWASWSRVIGTIDWDYQYDLIKVKQKLQHVYGSALASSLFQIVEHAYQHKNTWDVDLFLHIIMNEKKGISPNVNLVSNIGLTGTHYSNSKSALLHLPTTRMTLDADFRSRYTPMPKEIKKRIIQNYVNLSNPLTFRDKFYLFRKWVKEKLSISS